tara:strand:+ start:8914 stop:10278 length:1365 start_codon:yes stop_codon:yes gene_type:complete
MNKSKTGLQRLQWLAFLSVVLTLTSCINRDKTPPSVSIINPIYDGSDQSFGEIFFVQFIADDDRDEGGIWRVELRSENGVNVLTSQSGLWQGQTTDTLVVPFLLNAPQWNTSTMTLAVVVDDAAGNRAAAFQDFNYTGSDDIPETAVALTQELDGSSQLIVRSNPNEVPTVFSNLPLSHSLAIQQNVIALGHVEEATVLLLDPLTGQSVGSWTDATTEGAEPLIRRVHPLEIQTGFLVVHAGGLVALSTSGLLLFERFTEAPWSPVDAVFSGNQLVIWERNNATQNDRLRSWNYATGAAGPIIALPFNVQGIGAVDSHTSDAPGGLVLISETQGLTLSEPSTGQLDDLCPLIGAGNLSGSHATTRGESNGYVIFERGDDVCKQVVGDVSSGSQWPVSGTLLCTRPGPESTVWLAASSTGTEHEVWSWHSSSDTPELVWTDLPVNTVDIGFVMIP